MPKNPRACKMSGEEDCPWLTLMTMIEQYETLAAVPVITTGPSAKIALMHVRSLQRLSDALDLCIDHVGGWKPEMFGAWPTYDVRGRARPSWEQARGQGDLARRGDQRVHPLPQGRGPGRGDRRRRGVQPRRPRGRGVAWATRTGTRGGTRSLVR